MNLGARLLNIYAIPGDVFDEVMAAPPKLANWLVPTLLTCLAALSLSGTTPPAGTRLMAACLSPLAGALWSAFVLWSIGRVFLRVRLSYLKTLEIVGLTGMILLLGTLITALWGWAAGDATIRPALSMLLRGGAGPKGFRQVLELLNVFQLWSASVLAVGLSKLGGVSFKEAAFWVFGYWFLLRLALILLAW